MAYSAEITSTLDAGSVVRLFKAEDKDFKHGRSSYTICKNGNKVVFSIKADDSSSLRSTVNSIIKILAVYEKAKRS